MCILILPLKLPLKISHVDGNLYIAVHRHPNTPMITQSFNNLSGLVKMFNRPFIVGDFNAHHSLWGVVKIDSLGMSFVNLLNDNDLVLLSPPKPTFVSGPSRPSKIIDQLLQHLALSELPCRQ